MNIYIYKKRRSQYIKGLYGLYACGCFISCCSSHWHFTTPRVPSVSGSAANFSRQSMKLVPQNQLQDRWRIVLMLRKIWWKSEDLWNIFFAEPKQVDSKNDWKKKLEKKNTHTHPIQQIVIFCPLQKASQKRNGGFPKSHALAARGISRSHGHWRDRRQCPRRCSVPCQWQWSDEQPTTRSQLRGSKQSYRTNQFQIPEFHASCKKETWHFSNGFVVNGFCRKWWRGNVTTFKNQSFNTERYEEKTERKHPRNFRPKVFCSCPLTHLIGQSARPFFSVRDFGVPVPRDVKNGYK